MVSKTAHIEPDSTPLKIRQKHDRRASEALPVHIGELLQAAGMNYDPATFASMSIEQHAEEGFKGLVASVLSAVYSGGHFVKMLELSNQSESPNRHFVREEAERRGVSYKTIYNMIDVYKLFSRCPESTLKTFSKLDYSKLIELKSLDETDLAQLAEGQEVYGITLETAQSCSVRELKSIMQAHRAEIKNLKQKIVDAERKMNVEAEKAAELLAENLELKKLTPERRSFAALRQQLFADMETLQGIAVRARKTYELSKNFQQDVAHEAVEAVIHPLMHLLTVMHGNAKLLMDDCYLTWAINPALPVNPPQPDSMTHHERFIAQQSAQFQAALTEQHFPSKKGKKP